MTQKLTSLVNECLLYVPRVASQILMCQLTIMINDSFLHHRPFYSNKVLSKRYSKKKTKARPTSTGSILNRSRITVGDSDGKKCIAEKKRESLKRSMEKCWGNWVIVNEGGKMSAQRNWPYIVLDLKVAEGWELSELKAPEEVMGRCKHVGGSIRYCGLWGWFSRPKIHLYRIYVHQWLATSALGV